MKVPAASEIPEYFYKYRSLSDEQQLGWLRQLLLANEFYWANPSEFNDPFDCAPVYAAPARSGRALIASRVIRQNEPGLNRRSRKARERQFRRTPRNKLEAQLNAEMPTLINETAVYSLATESDNVLMWSHYANAHQGVCLRFRSRPLYDKFEVGLPVHYAADRPIINVGFEEPTEIVKKMLLTKADYWQYEKEWRFIDYRGRSGIRIFPREALDGIIFGARICEAHAETISTWITERSGDTPISRAQFDSRRFRLDIVDA